MAKATFLPASSDRDDDVDVFDTYSVDDNGAATTQRTKFEELLDALNDSDETANIHIYRQSGSGRESMAFLDSFPVDKYSLDEILVYLRDKYGTGDYRLMVRQGGKLKANKLYSVEAAKKHPTGNGEQSELTTLLGQMMERQERSEQMLLQLAQQNRQPQSESKADWLKEMMLYKELFGGGGNQQSGGLGQIQEALSFVEKLGIKVGGGDSDREPGFGDLLEKLTPLITHAIEHKETEQPKQPDRPKGPTPEQQKAQQMNAMLKMGLSTLISAARKQSDAGFYADFILDQVPPETAAAFLTAPDAFEKIKAINPLAEPYKPWFDDLSEHVKGQLGMPSKFADLYADDVSDIIGQENTDSGASGATDVHSANDTERQGGNAGNPQRDGEASKAL